MSSNWPFKRLGDCCEKIGSGATPKGGKDAYLEEGSIYLIRSQNIYNDGFKASGIAFISEEQAKKLDNVSVKTGDVLLNITGDSVARVCQAPEKFMPARVNQHVAIIRPKPTEFDAGFLRYFLASPAQQDLMLGLASAGATRNALTKVMIEDFNVPCPSLEVQKGIAGILCTIDERISLLKETNNTLEAIAQAIFKSWFIDFDLVRLNAEESLTHNIDSDIAALFPNDFEKTELGLLPQGWQIKSLSQVANYMNGLALQKFPPTGKDDLDVIKIAQLRKGDTVGADKASRSIKKEYIVNNGDVLFSWSGSLEVEIWCGGEGALNQHLFKVTSDQYEKWFYYMWTKHHLNSFRSIAASKATTMGHIQRSHIDEAKVVVPSNHVIAASNAIFTPLIDSIVANGLRIQNLNELRDTLLPRLLSGQLSVNDATFQTQAA